MSRFTPASQRAPGPHGATGSPRPSDSPNWRPAEPVTWGAWAVVIGACIAAVAVVALVLGFVVHPLLGVAIVLAAVVPVGATVAWRVL